MRERARECVCVLVRERESSIYSLINALFHSIVSFERWMGWDGNGHQLGVAITNTAMQSDRKKKRKKRKKERKQNKLKEGEQKKEREKERKVL